MEDRQGHKDVSTSRGLGGKSGLHREGWFLTGTVCQKLADTESVTENRLPCD